MAEYNHIKEIFDNLKAFDTKTLLSSLEIITQDPEIKKIYLQKDREKLYSYVNPLFQKLKNKYGITHWYFILPDGHTFLRAHNKELYGDEITRFTFWKAGDTGKSASGIELGKTAYALRAVMPYYHDGELIGYMELGEEIDHFLDALKSVANHEFVFIANKQFLDKEKWQSVRNMAGLRNNWDDLADYVVITNVENEEEGLISKCFTEENMISEARGEILYQQIKKEDEVFQCAGHQLIDAGEMPSGMLLSLIDVNDKSILAKSANRIIFIFSALMFILIILINQYFFFQHKLKTKK